jgi:hypothetical protein
MIDYPNGSEALPEFGTWTAYAAWQCGVAENGTEPSEHTVWSYMNFEVGWGLWITSISASPATISRSSNTGETVKINVENNYMESVTALVTATLYDNLYVPIDTPADIIQPFVPGANSVTFEAIHITPYAFVGTAYATANCFTTWPLNGGTPFCPQIGGWYPSQTPNGEFIITP